jgi:hypothetical protein
MEASLIPALVMNFTACPKQPVKERLGPRLCYTHSKWACHKAQGNKEGKGLRAPALVQANEEAGGDV